MTRYSGHICGCVWDYFYGEIVQKEWEEYVAHLYYCADNPQLGADTFLVVGYRTNGPNAAQRRLVAEFMRRRESVLRNVKGHALALESLSARAAAIAIDWLFSKPFEERVFALPQPAIAWLATKSPQLDCESIWQDIAGSVLPEHLWSKV